MSGLRTRGQCFALGVFATAVSGAGAAGLVHLTGEVLSSISLVFGLLFFVFAARYYVAILAVLVAPGANGMNGKNGAEPPNGNMGGTAYPMISVHLPLYNEERVVDRLLTACTNLDYPNYEVVVVDDSTDGTVKILKEWILKQLETTIPRVKIVHRTNRAGFKGGALNEALKRTNPRAEFVAVFDADFVPPPDILKKFLAYFNLHSNNGGNNGTAAQNGNGASNGSAKYSNGKLAAVQGYQWHTLNRSENWLTRGISCEFSGSYMVDRTYQEVAGTLKMVAGSAYMIRADLLRNYGWSGSITEDWELTLRLYKDGYKVLYTPLIQAPGECPSTLGKLVKQRMRWAEGHTYNVKKNLFSVLFSSHLGAREKLEFLYYAPYYLQSLFLILGTLFWFTSDALLGTRLPFWTQTFGWALVFTNLLALPLMSLTGLFFEKRAGKDYPGLFSQFLLIYALAPYQAYAALKGLLEPAEGSWVRTFKSGRLAGFPGRLEPRKVIKNVLPPKKGSHAGRSKLPLAILFGVSLLMIAAFANGASSNSGEARPAYYFYNQPSPPSYTPYSNTAQGSSFLMHLTPPSGADASVPIGTTKGAGPVYFSDPAPSKTLLPFGAYVSIHVWVDAASGWTGGSTAPQGPLWATTTKTEGSAGTLEFRIDLYNPADNSVAPIPGASATEDVLLQPGVEYYEESWGSISQGAYVPAGDTLLVTIWCPDCSSPPTLLFNSPAHPSNVDFPIIVPEDSIPAAPLALLVPMVAGLFVEYRMRSRAEHEQGEPGYRRVQRWIIAAAAVLLLSIPLVLTFESLLTSIALSTGFDRVVGSIVPFESYAVGELLRGFGLPAGSNADSVWLAGGFVPLVASIDWNCAGWQGFVLFGLTSVAGMGEVRTFGRRSMVVVLGVLGIFGVNVLRILLVVLLGYGVGYPAALIFHDYGGTILTLLFLLAFWGVVLRREGKEAVLDQPGLTQA